MIDMEHRTTQVLLLVLMESGMVYSEMTPCYEKNSFYDSFLLCKVAEADSVLRGCLLCGESGTEDVDLLLEHSAFHQCRCLDLLVA